MQTGHDHIRQLTLSYLLIYKFLLILLKKKSTQCLEKISILRIARFFLLSFVKLIKHSEARSKFQKRKVVACQG